MASQIKIAIVVLIYQGEKFLPDLLTSFSRLSQNNYELEFIFVDNKSADNSLEIIKTWPNKYTLIANQTNPGAAAGFNLGFKKAIEGGADFIIRLDQDTVVQPNFIDQLLSVAQDYPQAGAIQPLILYWPPELNKINSWGTAVHYLGIGVAAGNTKFLNQVMIEKLKIREIAAASGAAAMFRTQALKQIGLFDETYFLYREDTDLSLRLRQAGWQILLAPSAKIYHKYKFSLNAFKYYYLERGRLYLFLKFYQPLTYLLLLPPLLLLEAGLTYYAFRQNFLKERFKAYWWLLNNLKVLKIKRQELKRLRCLNDRKLSSIFTTTIQAPMIKSPLMKYLANPFFTLYWRLVRIILWW